MHTALLSLFFVFFQWLDFSTLPQNDERIAVVFCGEGGSQNGRMAECLNAAAKESLPILFVVIDNGRAINTFTPDVATNSHVFSQVR